MIKQPRVLTVSELTRDIKEVLESIFVEIRVEGEISNLRRPASGHIYYTLKDERSQIRCVFFKGQASGLKFSLKDGIKVICSGRVGVYERDGQYQLYINSVEPKGQGALQLAFQQLKEKLAKEGLFDESRKRTLKFLPDKIGVVTSPTGAVIRDMLNVLDRRFPGSHVIINPVRVQGAGAEDEVASAIKEFNVLDNVDVIILARGGGSLEDLWCFNEEVVARAIYNSKIPVLSAVGHETDYTIADFVADLRAPTPSAAAEIVMPSKADLEDKIRELLSSLQRALIDLVPQHQQRIDDLTGQMERAVQNRFKNEELVLQSVINELEALNPLAILKRGYSIAALADTGKVIFSAKEVARGSKIRTRLFDGEFLSEVTDFN